VAKSGTSCTNNQCSLSFSLLCKIPTGIFHKNSTDTVIDPHIDDDDRSPNTTKQDPSPNVAGNHSLSSSPALLSPEDDPYGYKYKFQCIAEVCDSMQQRQLSPTTLMQLMAWPMATVIPPEPLVHTNHMDAEFDYQDCLQAMANACEWMQQCRPLPLNMTATMPWPPATATPPELLACSSNTANTNHCQSDFQTMMVACKQLM